MDHNTAALIGLGIFAVVAIVIIVFFRSEVSLKFKSFLGQFEAKGKNPPPPSAVPLGVRIDGANAGKNLRAHSGAGGGVDLKKVEAEGDIDAAFTPGTQPPKS